MLGLVKTFPPLIRSMIDRSIDHSDCDPTSDGHGKGGRAQSCRVGFEP